MNLSFLQTNQNSLKLLCSLLGLVPFIHHQFIFFPFKFELSTSTHPPTHKHSFIELQKTNIGESFLSHCLVLNAILVLSKYLIWSNLVLCGMKILLFEYKSLNKLL